jgi:hypothetical protein
MPCDMLKYWSGILYSDAHQKLCLEAYKVTIYLKTLYLSAVTTMSTKSRTMEFSEHLVCMAEKQILENFGRKRKRKRPLRRAVRRWDNMKMNMK